MLLIATSRSFLEDDNGLISVTQTLFSNSNLFIISNLPVTVPSLNKLLLKSREGLEVQDPNQLRK